MIEDIKKILLEGEEEARRRAVEMLPKAASEHPDASLKLAVTALGDESWRVRKAAADAILGESFLGAAGLIEALIESLRAEDNAGLRNSAVEVLEKIGRPATGLLIEALKDPDPDIRKFITDILGNIGETSAVEAIAALLGDEDENVKGAASEALGKIGGPEVARALLAALKEDDFWLRFSALEALGSLKDTASVVPVEALTGFLTDDILKKAALDALGSTLKAEAIAHIAGALDDKGEATRSAAVVNIMRIYQSLDLNERSTASNTIAAIEPEHLAPLLESPLPEVIKSTVSLMGIVGAAKAEVVGTERMLELAKDEELREAVFDAFITMGKNGVGPLVRAYNSTDEKIRAYACHLLGELGDASAEATLTEALKDTYGHTRQAALLSLGKLKATGSVTSITELLRDKYDDVALAAVKAAVMIGEEHPSEVLKAVRGSKDDPSARIRRNVTIVLGGLGTKEVLPEIITALKDEESEVRKAAATALGTLGVPEALEHITVAIADEETKVRLAAIHALSNFKPIESEELLVLGATDEDIWVRCAALKGLSGCATPRSLETLKSAAANDVVPVAMTAIDTLFALWKRTATDDPETAKDSLDALRAALSHTDAQVVKAAEARLSEAGG